jgi:hypothetical protein
MDPVVAGMMHIEVDVNMPVREVVLLQSIFGDFGEVLLGHCSGLVADVEDSWDSWMYL